MVADPRYDLLFEPVPIGPVTAPNRFYQVPHCTGMGHRRPNTLAALRGIKAEGGWGVVCSEYCSIDPTSDDGYYPHARLWDDEDQAGMARVAEAIHGHGALAGVELWHGGASIANRGSREPPLSAGNRAVALDPTQGRRMDATDIRELRRRHRAAALRARAAGYDIVYVYAAHGYLLNEFLSGRLNDRSDDYGGTLENRARLVRELLEETREAVGDRCAVACRFCLAPEGGGVYLEEQESRDLLAHLAELPDLWDITIDDYAVEMGSSRFVKEAAQEEVVAFAKTVTSKPVVGVGRFTSPDTMVAQVRRGVLDLIGAARPSIADPFLPVKIREGRLDEIRECIGCNVCYAHNSLGVPIRCTQNPTMGEEWRRGWHPERVPARHAADTVLVVGGGPAGLEAAHVLGQRGYAVTLAEAGTELGGRVARESRLPGLAEWARVRDWRTGRLAVMPEVETFLGSRLTVEAVLETGARHVLVATGARWIADGTGRWRESAFEGWRHEAVLTPDDLTGPDWQGRLPSGGPVLVYDDDHYYLGPTLALRLRAAGHAVALVTPEPLAGFWGRHTEELFFANAALLEAGVVVLASHSLAAFDGHAARIANVFSREEKRLEIAAIVTVTRREPVDALWRGLAADPERLAKAGIETLRRIGDCDSPGTIAAAVYAGHRAARELGGNDAPPKRERPVLEAFSPPDESG